jgi:predicted Na+-dependent transporter
MSGLAWLAGRVISKDKGIQVSAYFIISQKSLATGIPLAFAIIPNDHDSLLASIIVSITAYHLFQLLMGSLLVAWMNSAKVKE